MRTTVGFLSLLWLGSTALAPALAEVTSTPPTSGAAVDAKGGTAAAGEAQKKGRKMRRTTVGTTQAPPSAPIPRQSCLDLWEPAIHMTKRAWARACAGLASD